MMLILAKLVIGGTFVCILFDSGTVLFNKHHIMCAHLLKCSNFQTLFTKLVSVRVKVKAFSSIHGGSNSKHLTLALLHLWQCFMCFYMDVCDVCDLIIFTTCNISFYYKRVDFLNNKMK